MLSYARQKIRGVYRQVTAFRDGIDIRRADNSAIGMAAGRFKTLLVLDPKTYQDRVLQTQPLQFLQIGAYVLARFIAAGSGGRRHRI